MTSPPEQPHAIRKRQGCGRRRSGRRFAKCAVDLAEVEAQPPTDSAGAQAVGVAVHPRIAHPQVPRDLLHADEVIHVES